MLQKRSDDKLQYFINIDRLPRTATDADRYFERFIATAVLLNGESQQQMHDESIALFQSASISTTNPPLQKIESAEK